MIQVNIGESEILLWREHCFVSCFTLWEWSKFDVKWRNVL